MIAASPIDNLDRNADDSRAENVLGAIKLLLADLPPAQQDWIHSEISKHLKPIAAPRAGEVLGAIIRLVPKDRTWTIEDVKKSVESQGIPATAKAIYNALGYLTRKKKIVRVGHGRYMVDGEMVITSDSLGGAPSRHEEDDT
jgi:hypothetical protein